MADSNTTERGRKLFKENYLLVEELVHVMSRQKRLRADEREDFTSYAMLKLVENDYGRLRKYRGRSSLKTYLTVVLQRLFLDFRTQKWGKWRPSATAMRLGKVAVRLETLIYRDGYGFPEAREVLLTTKQTDMTGDELWELVNQLPRRERFQRLDDEALHKVVAPRRENELERRDKKTVAERLESRLEWAVGKLSDEERVILKMRFDEGMSVPDIADALKVKPKALYARIGRLLKRLKGTLESAGVGWTALQPVLAWRELQVDLDRVFRTTANPSRPSVYSGEI